MGVAWDTAYRQSKIEEKVPSNTLGQLLLQPFPCWPVLSAVFLPTLSSSSTIMSTAGLAQSEESHSALWPTYL